MPLPPPSRARATILLCLQLPGAVVFPATDKISPIDEPQSLQKCLNLSGANAV
jgi:hypothetical protein